MSLIHPFNHLSVSLVIDSIQSGFHSGFSPDPCTCLPRNRAIRCILQTAPSLSCDPNLSVDDPYPVAQLPDVVRWLSHLANLSLHRCVVGHWPDPAAASVITITLVPRTLYSFPDNPMYNVMTNYVSQTKTMSARQCLAERQIMACSSCCAPPQYASDQATQLETSTQRTRWSRLWNLTICPPTHHNWWLGFLGICVSPQLPRRS